jgi:plasmid stabilization system protein ParE
MKCTVVWKPTAEEELARIWSDAVDKAAITTAANQIERDLETNPRSVGESRAGSNRIHFQPPLAIQFRVAKAHSLVYVLEVWLTRR